MKIRGTHRTEPCLKTHRETSLRPRLCVRLRLGLEIGQVESKPREQRGQQESSDHENNHKTLLDSTVYIQYTYI